jgi:hypothetical protein
MTDPKKEWRTRTRAWAYAELGGTCSSCGSSNDLEFDHLDPVSKEFEISAAIRDGYGRDRIAKELAKCQLLCGDCHQAKSSREARAKVTHGKYHAAYHLKCDCVLCLEYKATYNLKRPSRAKDPSKPKRINNGELIHGTYAGYQKEVRRGLEHCEPCKAANRENARRHRKMKEV